MQAIARVWTRENMTSSKGSVVEIPLEELERSDDVGYYGSRAAVDGPPSKEGDTCDVYQPGRKVTTNCFDKAQLYYGLTSVQRYLEGLGIKIYRSVDDPSGNETRQAFPVKAHANAVSDLNAWYSPQEMDLTFGTAGEMSRGEDKWHLASDNDVSMHELGHLTLDVINPMIGNSWEGEGSGIHEGFADSLPAFYSNDSEISEDFFAAIGEKTDEEKGMRDVDNNLKLSDVSTESHDRGQVYSGLFWSVKKALENGNGGFGLTPRQAADLSLKILYNHAYMYSTAQPTTADYVQAMTTGIDALASADSLGVDAGALKKVVLSEAKARGLLGQQVTPSKIVENLDEAKEIAGPRTVFGHSVIRDYIGGKMDIRQQYYMTESGLPAKVIDGFAIVRADADGTRVHAEGLRKINDGQINETVNITASKAYDIAATDARKKIEQSKTNYMKAVGGEYKNIGEYLRAVRNAQMDYRVAEAAVRKLQRNSFAPAPRPELVIIPGSNELYYEIKVGLAVYYVGVSTGDPKFRKDYFV
jgi:hypothetical protein